MLECCIGCLFFVCENNYFYFENAQISYDKITLKTLADNGNRTVYVFIDEINICDENCYFEFSSAKAPIISSVSPMSITDSTEIIINGKNFVNDLSLINVTIGSQKCLVSVASDTQIKCNLDGLDLGQQILYLNIECNFFFLVGNRLNKFNIY